MASFPSGPPSLSEEMLPTAAVMEGSCRRRHSPSLFNGEPVAAGRILAATCACAACARGSVLKFAPWMFLLSTGLKNDSH